MGADAVVSRAGLDWIKSDWNWACMAAHVLYLLLSDHDLRFTLYVVCLYLCTISSLPPLNQTNPFCLCTLVARNTALQ
jgi:hypothetical protein